MIRPERETATFIKPQPATSLSRVHRTTVPQTFHQSFLLASHGTIMFTSRSRHPLRAA